MSRRNIAYRSQIIHFIADPTHVGDENSYEYYPDGILLLNNGQVEKLGPAETLLREIPKAVEVIHYPDALIIPGFIDCHIHYPQTEMIAAFGERLIEWLRNYTFPTERAFEDPEKARDIAEFFLEELLRNGTTTAMVQATVHKTSVDAFFTAAKALNMRMICGKVMMDRNAPDYLCDRPESSYWDSKELIERWHHQDRLCYAVTPRFAPTSSDAQLAKAGQLLQEHPGLYLHTHLAENIKEVRWVRALFPKCRRYLEVYDHFNLVGERSIFAHGIHLNRSDFKRLHLKKAGIAFCPTSNLFLGSGLFNFKRAATERVSVGLGTDVGAGTSFSLLRTLNEAYKTLQLRRQRLSPFGMFYLATLGGARTLRLDDVIGNFEPGKEADFVVVDLHATPLLKRRLDGCQNIAERLFVLAMLGDDRAILATHILGEPVYHKRYS